MLELYDVSQFQTWCIKTNDLHQAAHIETNEPLHHFVPFSTTASATSRYYLYQHLQAGLCGSVEMTQLAKDRMIEQKKLKRGTWIIKDSYFFLSDDHPLSAVGLYEPLIRGFYQAVFEIVCRLSRREDFPYAVTCHHWSHGDFAMLGDFTFVCEWREIDWLNNRTAMLGLLSLKDQNQTSSIPMTPQEHQQVQPILPHLLKTPSAPRGTQSLNRG